MSEDKNTEHYPTYEQAGGSKEWDEMTELERAYYDIRKLKNALAVNKNTIQRLRATASPVSDAVEFAEYLSSGYRLISDRSSAFVSLYYQIQDEEVNELPTPTFTTKEIYSIFKSENSTPTNVQEQDKLWDEVEVIFDSHTVPTGGGYEADYTDKDGLISELKSKYTITKKQ